MNLTKSERQSMNEREREWMSMGEGGRTASAALLLGRERVPLCSVFNTKWKITFAAWCTLEWLIFRPAWQSSNGRRLADGLSLKASYAPSSHLPETGNSLGSVLQINAPLPCPWIPSSHLLTPFSIQIHCLCLNLATTSCVLLHPVRASLCSRRWLCEEICKPSGSAFIAMWCTRCVRICIFWMAVNGEKMLLKWGI